MLRDRRPCAAAIGFHSRTNRLFAAVASPECRLPSAQFAVTEEMLKEGVKIRKGKKVFHKAVLA